VSQLALQVQFLLCLLPSLSLLVVQQLHVSQHCPVVQPILVDQHFLLALKDLCHLEHQPVQGCQSLQHFQLGLPYQLDQADL